MSAADESFHLHKVGTSGARIRVSRSISSKMPGASRNDNNSAVGDCSRLTMFVSFLPITP